MSARYMLELVVVEQVQTHLLWVKRGRISVHVVVLEEMEGMSFLQQMLASTHCSSSKLIHL